MMTIDELIEHAVSFARRELVGKPDVQLMPTWTIQGAKRVTVVASPFEGEISKDLVAFGIRKLLKDENAASYSFMSEAWMLHQGVGEPYVQPMHSPKRIEVLMINAFNHAGGKHCIWKIKRDGQGVVSELEPVPNADDADHFEGRFYNLLQDERQDTK